VSPGTRFDVVVALLATALAVLGAGLLDVAARRSRWVGIATWVGVVTWSVLGCVYARPISRWIASAVEGPWRW
jgi:hypothetical protein